MRRLTGPAAGGRSPSFLLPGERGGFTPESASSNSSGFTVIEVLVAFSVAAILSLTFIAAQHRALQVASEFSSSWEQINLAQEFFAERPFDEIRRVSMGWASWKGRPEISRRIDEDSTKRLAVLPGTRKVLVTGGWNLTKSVEYSLRIKTDGRENQWSWIGMRR